MEKQVFLDFNLRFNLRQTRKNKPTIIYAVICYQGRQWKINTGVKVYPNHWSISKQVALCGSGLTQLDNRNNSIVNIKIKQVLCVSEEIKNYLCNTLNSLDNDFYPTLKAFINPTMKIRIMAKKIKYHAILELCKVVDKKHTKDSSKDTDKRQIDIFAKFLKEKNIPDDIYSINITTIEDYQQWLIESVKENSTVEQYVKKILSLSKGLEKSKEYDFDCNKQKLHKVEVITSNLTKRQRKERKVALTEEQLEIMYDFSDLRDVDKEVRDIFILQCLLGQRIEDLRTLLKQYEIKEYNGVELIIFRQQKKNQVAIIPLFPLAKKILAKYRYGFEHINFKRKRVEGLINDRIKKIGQRIKFDKIHSFQTEKGNVVKDVSKPLYEMLHTHIARHTFITLMCRFGVPKDALIIATGHTNTKMIEDVYLHQTDEDRTKIVINAFQHIDSTIFNMQTETEVEQKAEVDTPIPVPTQTSAVNSFDYTQVKDDIIKLVQTEQENEKLKQEVDKLQKYKTIKELEEKMREYEEYDRELGMGLHNEPS